jgi:hypothetical protein
MLVDNTILFQKYMPVEYKRLLLIFDVIDGFRGG